MAKTTPSANNAFAAELKKMNSSWSDAPENTNLPEGEYTFTVQNAEIKKAQSSGKLRAVFTLAVAEGEHAGATIQDGYNLDAENTLGMSMLKAQLGRYGYEIPESLTDVVDILEAISAENPMVIGKVKQNGDFTNVRITEVLDGAAAKEGGEEEAPAEEEGGEGEEAAEIMVGSTVTFTVEDEEITATITKKHKDGSFDAENDDESFEKIDPSELTLVGDEEEGGEDGEAEDNTDLLELVAAHGIPDIEEDMARADIIEALGGYEWKREELTDDEAALLEASEIEVIAKKKVVVKPIVKAAPAKTAAKPIVGKQKAAPAAAAPAKKVFKKK